MPCTITDQLVTYDGAGNPNPLIGAQVVALPDTTPIFINSVEVIQPVRTVRTDSNGFFTVVLPTQSETDPGTTQWRLVLPDGTTWQGAVPNSAGALTIHDLKDSFGWGLIAGGPIEPPIIAVQGPPGGLGSLMSITASLKTRSFALGRQIGDGLYDARFLANEFGDSGNPLVPGGQEGSLELIHDPAIPSSVLAWGEIIPDDGSGLPRCRIRFNSTLFANQPSVGQINDVFQNLQHDGLSGQLSGGAPNSPAAKAQWDGDPGTVFAELTGPAGNAYTLFLADDSPGGVTIVQDSPGNFTAHYEVDVSTYFDLLTAIRAIPEGPDDLIDARAPGGGDLFTLDSSLNGYGGGFSGGQDFTPGTRAFLDCFPLGQHRIDTVIEAADPGSAGNSITVQITDSLPNPTPPVSISRIGNAFTIVFQDGVATVGDIETAIGQLVGPDALIRVKTPGTGARVLGRLNFMFLDSDFPGSVNVNTLTPSTVGVVFLTGGSDHPAVVYQDQPVSVNAQLHHVGTNPRITLVTDNLSVDTVFSDALNTAKRVTLQPATGSDPVRFEFIGDDDSGQQVSRVLVLQLVQQNIDLPANPPKLFYTATFDGLNGGGYITNQIFAGGTLVVQGSNNNPFFQFTLPQQGDRLVFLAEVGARVGFLCVTHGLNGQGLIPLTGGGVFNASGAGPNGGDVVLYVAKLDPATKAWVGMLTPGADFGPLIQFSGPSLFQNTAADLSTTPLAILFQHGGGLLPTTYDGGSSFVNAEFASTIDNQGRLLQRSQGDLSGKSYVAVFARPS